MGLETRRRFVIGAVGTLAVACTPSHIRSSGSGSSGVAQSLGQVEEKIGGRLGVFALDTHTGRQLAHRADERFAMCSTFKWVLAAQVLDRVERAHLSLDERIPFGPTDLLEYAPATREHLAEGSMTVEALARAAVIVSDNTAANLLLGKVGGPAGFTQFVRSLGDQTTRLDRYEPALNSNDAGDPRDTTSPRAMVGLMSQLLGGNALSLSSRQRLLDWLGASETGKARLRAGLPKDWKAGDKTGTGMNGACNDVAMAWPPRRGPVLIAVYMSDGPAALDSLQNAHAELASIVAREMGSS